MQLKDKADTSRSPEPDLPALDRARRQVWRFQFEPPLEAAFRRRLRLQYAWPRGILWLLVAFGFGLAPLYQALVFSPEPDFIPTLLFVELVVVAPTALAAAYVSLRRSDLVWAQSAHLIAVIAFWGGVTFLHASSLAGKLTYSSQMVGVALIAVAMFGGYRFRLIAPGAVAIAAIAIAVEVQLNNSLSLKIMNIYVMMFTLFIAVFGALVVEVLVRLSWINIRVALLLARTDPLTGVPNRVSFIDNFERVVRNAARERKPVVAAMLDLDHFKSINDIYGHLVGDEVLRKVGAVLREHAGKRPLDLHARYGGEEFVIVLYNLSEEDLRQCLERVCAQIRLIEIPIAGALPLKVTTSIGAVMARPHASTNPDTLLHQADAVLYLAKQGGRDRIEIRAASAVDSVAEVKMRMQQSGVWKLDEVAD